MRKLITANFHRFSKDRFSWCVLGIVVILSLGNVFNSVGSFETTKTNAFCLGIILCNVSRSFDYLIYPYYPAYTS